MVEIEFSQFQDPAQAIFLNVETEGSVAFPSLSHVFKVSAELCNDVPAVTNSTAVEITMKQFDPNLEIDLDAIAGLKVVHAHPSICGVH